MDDVEGVYRAAVGDDIMLEGDVSFVCVAECGAGFDLIDIDAAVRTAVHHIGEDKHFVVEKTGFENVYLFFIIQQ